MDGVPHPLEAQSHNFIATDNFVWMGRPQITALISLADMARHSWSALNKLRPSICPYVLAVFYNTATNFTGGLQLKFCVSFKGPLVPTCCALLLKKLVKPSLPSADTRFEAFAHK